MKLHILNGDATLSLFEKSELGQNQRIVWREMLVEGPLNGSIQQKEFWDTRKEFFRNVLDIPENDYNQKVLDEIKICHNLGQFREVVLWFEYDSFCQINMLGVLNLIDHDNISLINVGDEDGLPFKGLGQFGAERYSEFFQNRQFLSSSDRDIAGRLWNAYRKKDLVKLQEIYTAPSFSFKYLKESVTSLLQLSKVKNGLDMIDLKILEIAKSAVSQKEIVRRMLKWQEFLGFGDMQYVWRIKKLSNFIKGDFSGLTPAGNQVLKNY